MQESNNRQIKQETPEKKKKKMGRSALRKYERAGKKRPGGRPKKPRERVRSRKFRMFERILLADPTARPAQIAFDIYDCKNMKVAAAVASRNMRIMGITLNDLLDREGLGDEADASDVKRLSNAKKLVKAGQVDIKDEKTGKTITKIIYKEVEDLALQEKILNMRLKLKGKLQDGRGNQDQSDEEKEPSGSTNYITILQGLGELDASGIRRVLKVVREATGTQRPVFDNRGRSFNDQVQDRGDDAVLPESRAA